MAGTPGLGPISPRLQRIAEQARAMPQVALTTLAHHLDHDLLLEAYRRTRKVRDPADRDPDLRGQGPAARRGDAARSRLRAGLPRLLVWLPAGSLGAPGPAKAVEGVDGPGRRLGAGAGRRAVLRHAGPRAAAGDPSPTGTRRGAAPSDREVAARGRAGGGAPRAPRCRHATGGCHDSSYAMGNFEFETLL